MQAVTRPPVGTTREADRAQAALHYIFDPEQHDLAWWHRTRYAHIKISAFQNWSASDEWPRRRAEHVRNIERAVARKIVSKITSSQVEEVEELLTARRMAKEFVVGVDGNGKPVAVVPPKTFGESVSAFVKLDERVDEKRAAVMGALPLAMSDEQTGDVTAGIVSLPFNDEEVRAMAEAAVRTRFGLPAEEKK